MLINLRPTDAEWFVEQLVTRICTDDGGWSHTTHRALLEEFMVRAVCVGAPHRLMRLLVQSRVAKVGTEWLSLLLAVLGRLSQSSTSPALLKGALGLFDALVPSISGTQAWTVLEAGVRLMKNGDAAVAAAAVRTMVSLFGVTRQAELVDRMKAAVTEVTAHGPRQSIVDVLNAFARYIPSMEPPVANQFVLKLVRDGDHAVWRWAIFTCACHSCPIWQSALLRLLQQVCMRSVRSAPCTQTRRWILRCSLRQRCLPSLRVRLPSKVPSHGRVPRMMI